ncbi:MAG TPA: hypothetical protein VEG84_06255, partial [Thermoanaerobaculia bacterium]|nr:hypothetical protein [Thermoanaerobaculia bacterium]
MRQGELVEPESSDFGAARRGEAKRRSQRRRRFAGLAAAGLCASLFIGCTATAGIKPVASHDSEMGCPGGRLAWNLQIADQRAKLEDSARLIGVIRESLSRSLPDCRWTSAQADAGTISIELHKFGA